MKNPDVVKAVCRMPRAFKERHVSMIGLIEESGYLRRPDDASESDLEAYLRDHPDLVDAWLADSAENRSSPAWFFKIRQFDAPDGESVKRLLRDENCRWIVGREPGDELREFRDGFQACAFYVKRRAEQLREFSQNPPRSGDGPSPRPSSLTQTPARERIFSLDALRGFAVLGILVMNIQSFSMVAAAYFNPTAYGDFTGLNRWVWIIGHLLTDLKFMTLFAFLFGAGILLMASRAQAKGLSPARFHFRRTAGLLLFGLIHAYFFWYGDILVWYSLCSLIVFFFRNRSPRTLVVLGLLSFAVPSLFYFFVASSLPHMPPEIYQELALDWQPGPEKVAQEVAFYQSGWLGQMEHRVPMSVALHTFVFAVWAGWRVCGVMLIGMALFKWGILSAERSRRFYVLLALAGFGAGWPLIAYGIVQNFAQQWSFDYSRFVGTQFNYWGSLPVSIGYVGLLMLLCQTEWVSAAVRKLAAVGRLAFTNYLGQTVICTTIFYGHGLGLFGTVPRTGQIAVVAGVLAFQIVFSSWWLKRFRIGPVEAVWRSLTYWTWEPLRTARRRS